MGRPGKAGKALERVDPASIVDPIDSAQAQALVARFLELRRQTARHLVDASTGLGEILDDARRILRGHYQRWLAERLGVEPRTAGNYVALARLARDSPALVERHRELGVAKLYQLARIAPEPRAEILRTPDLQRLTDVEFHALTARHRKPARKVTGNMRAQGILNKLTAMDAELSRLTAPRVTDDDKRAQVRRRLLDLARTARALAERFR